MLRRLARPSRRRQCPISVAPSGSDTYRSGVGRPLEIPGDGGTEDQVEGEPERSGEWEEQQGERDHEGDTAQRMACHGGVRHVHTRTRRRPTPKTAPAALSFYVGEPREHAP